MTSILILTFLTAAIFREKSILKILILMEMLGFFWFVLVMASMNLMNYIEGYKVILFSVLVIEGIIALYGLVLLINFSGKDYFLGWNL